MTGREAESRLRALADDTTAEGMRRFFKTGPGQHGEGDQFLGIKVPPLRRVAHGFRTMPLDEAKQLLSSAFHEARLLALLVLVEAFEKGDETARKAIFDLYLANTARVNNWDLVDTSAPAIVGGFLVRVLGTERVWAFHAFGARVVAFRFCEGPLLLLADHRPTPSCMPIFAVADLDASTADLKARGWRSEGDVFEVPVLREVWGNRGVLRIMKGG